MRVCVCAAAHTPTGPLSLRNAVAAGLAHLVDPLVSSLVALTEDAVATGERWGPEGELKLEGVGPLILFSQQRRSQATHDAFFGALRRHFNVGQLDVPAHLHPGFDGGGLVFVYEARRRAAGGAAGDEL